MKRLQRIVVCLLFLAVLTILPVSPAQAKTKVTKAESYELLNVKNAPERSGSWIKKQDRYYFELANGSLLKSRWLSQKGSIYYLNANGVRTSGWISYNGALYYTKKGGKLHTGWMKLDGKKYYLNEKTGRLVKGFRKIGEDIYYFSQGDGAMRTGWLKAKDKKYYLNEKSGKMTKGFRKIGNYTYYFSPAGGAMRTGWQTISGDRYYFNVNNGIMAVSRWIPEGDSLHYLDASGKMVKSDWLTLEDRTYYLDDSGERATGTIEIDGKFHHFDEYGLYLPNRLGGIIDSSKPMVALTFDDGPSKYTDRLLDCLQKYNVKATFFMVGSCVGRYPDAVKRMAEFGCELGNHSYDHPFLSRLSQSARKSQISRTSEAIKNACGQYPTLVRLPYGDGAFSNSVLSGLGYPSIYWSVDTKDYMHTGSPQYTVNAVLSHVRDGDIVLLHDLHRSTVIAAESIIPALIKRGYQLVTVSELAEYKGKTKLQAGKTYKGFR